MRCRVSAQDHGHSRRPCVVLRMYTRGKETTRCLPCRGRVCAESRPSLLLAAMPAAEHGPDRRLFVCWICSVLRSAPTGATVPMCAAPRTNSAFRMACNVTSRLRLQYTFSLGLVVFICSQRALVTEPNCKTATKTRSPLQPTRGTPLRVSTYCALLAW